MPPKATTAPKPKKAKNPELAPFVHDPNRNAPPPMHVLSDQEVIDALNTRVDEEGEKLEPVTPENVWNECRAREVGHRSCRCGNPGCGKMVTGSK